MLSTEGITQVSQSYYFILSSYFIFSWKKNKENHWARIMGPKPWVQNHEPKTTRIDY